MACVQAIFPLEDRRMYSGRVFLKMGSDDRELSNGMLFLLGLINLSYQIVTQWCAPAHHVSPFGSALGIWTSLWLVGAIIHVLVMMGAREWPWLLRFLTYGSPFALPIAALWFLAACAQVSYEIDEENARERREGPARRHARQWAKTANLRMPSHPTTLVLEPGVPVQAETISEAV